MERRRYMTLSTWATERRQRIEDDSTALILCERVQADEVSPEPYAVLLPEHDLSSVWFGREVA